MLLGSLKSQLHLRNTTIPDCPLVFLRIIKTKENPLPSWLPIGGLQEGLGQRLCQKRTIRAIIS